MYFSLLSRLTDHNNSENIQYNIIFVISIINMIMIIDINIILVAILMQI